MQATDGALGGVAGTLPVVKPEVPARANALLDHMRLLEKALNALKRRLAWAPADELVARALQVAGMKMLAATLQGANAKALREETLGKRKDRLKSAAIMLATVDGGKVQLAAGVTPNHMVNIKAGKLVNFVGQQVGGKPDMAMDGGTDPSKPSAALDSVRGWVAEQI